jgi:hypothetical protein
MRRRLILALAAPALLGAPAFIISPALAAPANPGPSRTVADPIPAKPPLTLTDAQKSRIVQAMNGRDTLEEPPAGFTPAIGAKVPTQKKLHAHPMPRPLVYEIPALKQYYYAQLADSVLIIDPMTRKVVDIVKR